MKKNLQSRGGGFPSWRAGARRGSVLIVALGVLTLLSILGIAFASLMRLERKAAENFIDGKRMDHLLDSALDRVIADLHGAKDFRSFTVYQDTPWLFLLKKEQDLAHGRASIDDPQVGAWELFSQEEGQQGSYKTKVIDCAAQININGEQDTLARILDNLGKTVERSARLSRGRDGRNITNPFREGPNQGNLVRGEDIIRFRRLLPEGRFTSKSQLKWIIGPENYEAVKDFITCYSWVDPYTYRPTDGLDEVSPYKGVTSGGGGGLGGSGVQNLPSASDTPRVDPEPRHPININTAPEEVLTAVIMGLAGRRSLPYSRLGSAGGAMLPIDQNADVFGDRVLGNEEVQNVTPRNVFVYSPELRYEQAKRIADRIIQQRKVKPFMTWRSNDLGLPGFEDFVDGLDSSFFPAFSEAIVVDSDQPNNRQIETDVKSNITSLVGLQWQRGHDNRERPLRRQFGLPMHERNAWYYELVKGVLKANFNPNTRLNRYNPNAPAFVPVDQSDLVWLQKDRQTLNKGHTTEFCFDTMGFYEVTALGRYEPVVTGVGPRGPRTSVGGSAESAAAVDPASTLVRPFERKMRSIVQTYGVLRHTNQLHFEKTFSGVQSRSSKADRKYIITYPEPMAALTELYSQGSQRDGRVELAGLLDGDRLQVDVRSRAQLYRTHPSVVMAHGFQDRDAASISRLQRALRSGATSLLSDEVSDALREVLNANFVQGASTDGEYVQRAKLLSLGGVLSVEAIHSDPLVQKEVLGNDLMPDGIHSSILRTTHLQCRTLILPARQPIGDAPRGGQGNPTYGATGENNNGMQNIVGNVPYYRGGVAFWVKFDFDARDPVFSGLIGCTQVIREVFPAPTLWQGSEGTQFFIYKNSEGFLRITRMYYHQAFYDSGDDGGGGEGILLYPDANAAEGGLGDSNPIADQLDKKKLVSRSDIIVDIRHFRAHEWHHIAVDWDDNSVGAPIRLYLDFQEERGVRPVLAQQERSGIANSWVRLNERQPKDGLQVGGIIRNQGVADAGVFKWYTNTTSTSGGGGGVQTIAQSVKRIMANATIDELITYEGEFPAAKQYYGASGAPGYFTQQRGEYANLFEIAVPPDVDSVVLRSFDWTSYYPVMYTDSRPNSVPTQVRINPIDCQIFYRSPVPPPQNFQEPWRQPSVLNKVAGRRAYRAASGIVGQNVEFVYKFSMSGGRSNSGNTAGGVVGSPVIDDVTLTYYLTTPKIHLQEELD